MIETSFKMLARCESQIPYQHIDHWKYDEKEKMVKTRTQRMEEDVHLCNAGALFKLGIEVLIPILEDECKTTRREGEDNRAQSVGR